MKKKELLIEFINWARNSNDIYYIFDNTEEAVDEFLEENKETRIVISKGRS